MSGSGSTSWSEQLGALTFAVIMVASVVVPFLAFGVGTASATASNPTLTSPPVNEVQSGATVTVTVDIGSSGGDATIAFDGDNDGDLSTGTNTGADGQSSVTVTDGGADDQDGTDGTVTFQVTVAPSSGSFAEGSIAIVASEGSTISGSGDVTVTDFITVDDTAPTVSRAVTADTNNDGDVNQITVTLGENIDDSDSTLSASVFTLGSGSVDKVDTGTTADDDTIVLTVSGLSGTDVTPSINGDGSGITIEDDAGNPLTTADGSGFDVATDGAAPVLLTAEVTDPVSSSVTLTFSEPIKDAGSPGNAFGTGDLTYADFNGDGASDVSSVDTGDGSFPTNTVRISLNNPISSGDIGVDAIAPKTGIQDESDTSAETNSVKLSEPGSGPDNGEIQVSIDGGPVDNVNTGSATQSLGLLTIKDLTDTGALADRTKITLPEGITFNQSATDLSLSTSNADGVTITGSSFSSDGRTLTIQHDGASTAGETLRISGVVVDVDNSVTGSPSGNAVDISVDYALGSFSDTNLLDVYKPSSQFNSGSDQSLGAATTGSDLAGSNGFTITTNQVDGQIAVGSNLVIFANQSNSITFDTSVDPTKIESTTSGTSGDLDIQNASISANKLVIPVNETFSADASVSVGTGAVLAANASGEATDSILTAEVSAVDSTGAVSVEQPAKGFNIVKPNVEVGASTSTGSNDVVGKLTAGRTGQSPNNNGEADEITVTLTADGQIAAGTNVSISLNNSAVTFDQSTTPSDSITDSASVGDVTVNANTIEISITGADLQDGDTLTIGDSTGIDFNVSASASEVDVQYEVTTQPGQNRDKVTVTDQSTSGSDLLRIERPDVTFNNGNNFTVFVGDTGNQSAGSDIAAPELQFSEDGNQLDLDSNQDNNVTITLPADSGVTFSQNSNSKPGLTGSNLGEIGDSAVTVVDGNTINVTIPASGIDDGDLESFQLTELRLNATSDAANATFTFSVNTTSVSQTTSSTVVIEQKLTTGSINNGANRTVFVDDTPADGGVANESVELSANDLSVTFGVSDDVPSGDLNITFSLPADSGVSFDQSQSPTVATNDISGSPSVTIVDGTTINVTITGGSGGSDGDVVALNNVRLNATEDASDATVTFSVNKTNGAISGKTVASQILVEEYVADSLSVPQSDQVTVNKTTEITTVSVSNGSTSSPFSGAEVLLEVNDTTTGVTTDVSSAVTAQDGTVAFNVTGGSVANEEFNVTVTLARNTSITKNITITTTAGQATNLNATSVQDAIIETGSTADDPEEVVLVKVRVEDSQGNLVGSSDVDVDVSSIGLNVSGSVLGVTEDIDSGVTDDFDSVGAGTDVTTDDGVFYVGVSRSSGTQDISVVTATEDLGSDSATATVFENPASVELTVANDSTPLTAGQNVEVQYVAVDSNGEDITVAGLDITPSSSNSAVVSQLGTGSVETNGSGVASATFTVDSAGSADIQGIEQRTNIIGSLSVTTELPTLNVTLNVTEVDTSNETTVEANVTFANNGTAVEGATVNVTGAGVDVSDQTTPANGSVTFTVNASTADTITVEATKSDTNAGTATIEATPAIPPIGSASNSPTDPDGDGTFEDLNGNGEFDIGDVTVLFNEINDPAIQNNLDAFDFNGDGEVTTSDVTALFNEGVEQDEGTGGFGTTTETTQSLADGFTAISSESED